ncbi:MAG: hypothetical protein U9N59_04110 [Campylobacterota bacterium]|nr:hypothetical protein [Campylobacterota bacterium]
MKRAVNLRLEENIIYTLNQLSKELHTTKTDIIEKAINIFSKENNLKKNNLLQFAGVLKNVEADKLLLDIKTNKNTKDLEFDLC